MKQFNDTIEALRHLQRRHNEYEIIVCGSTSLNANDVLINRALGDVDIVIKEGGNIIHPSETIAYLESRLKKRGIHEQSEQGKEGRNTLLLEDGTELHAIMSYHAFFSESPTRNNGLYFQAPIDNVASKLVATADTYNSNASKTKANSLKHAKDFLTIIDAKHLSCREVVQSLIISSPQSLVILRDFVNADLQSQPEEIKAVQQSIMDLKPELEDCATLMNTISDRTLLMSRLQDRILLAHTV